MNQSIERTDTSVSVPHKRPFVSLVNEQIERLRRRRNIDVGLSHQVAVIPAKVGQDKQLEIILEQFCERLQMLLNKRDDTGTSILVGERRVHVL